jgi:plastocyanin
MDTPARENPMPRLLLIVAAALLIAAAVSLGRAGVTRGQSDPAATSAAASDMPQPPIADPQALVAAYYQTFAAAVNSGDFTPLAAFFTPDAGLDSGLGKGGASGPDAIVAFFQKLPPLSGFSVETSNLVESDPYVDVDWRFRAAPSSLRGYLDGHDSFKIQDGLITYLEQDVDQDAVAEAFMPPPSAPAPVGPGVARRRVTIENFSYAPAVIRVPVGAKVTWENDDADAHTVTTDDKSIDSGVVEQGVSADLTFSAAGEYPYYCTIHPGMRGKVIVTAP